MKNKLLIFICVIGYFTICCNGEEYMSSTTGSTNSIGSTSSTADERSEYVTSSTIISRSDDISSTDIVSSTEGPRSTEGTSTTSKTPVKNVVVQDVVRKICRLAKKSLKDAKPEERPAIFQHLKNKITKASRGVGKSYVEIIMKGIRGMAERNDYTVCDEEDNDIVNAPPDLVISTSTPPPTPQPEIYNNSVTPETEVPIMRRQNEVVKQKLLSNMIAKIEKIAKKSFENSTKPEDKVKVLEKIKKKLIKVMQRKNETLKGMNTSYTDLILEGIKYMMNRDKDPRRMTFEFVNKGNEKDQERRPPALMFLQQQDGSTQSTPYALMSSVGFTTEYDCSAIQKKICKSLHQLNEFICTYDDTVISVEKICDGHIDCPDGNDEKNCTKQAVSRVHTATEIMKDVGLAKSCLIPLIESSMLSGQAKMMTEVLKNEIEFINKYTKRYPYLNEKDKIKDFDHRSLMDLSSEVCFLIRSFVIALDGALCTDVLQSVDEMVNKLSEPLDKALDRAVDIDVPLKDFRLKICDCNGPLCTNMTCPSGCRRLCFERHSLMLWTCRATDGSNGVTLDLICDGKFDCYDETDETGCVLYNSAAKFEANKIYDSVLKTIRTITGHFGFEMARAQLGQLHDTIRTLQIKSMNPKTPNEEFKKFRDKAFLLIVDIFDESLNSVTVDLKASTAFDFLESIKEKLLIALKKTFTGNKKIIAPDGCFCRGLECALPVCSRKCIRTCMSKPKLTRYLCSSTNSTSIPLEQICNGRKNCPKGEDEDKCKPELCRRHHVVTLRSKLTKVGDKHAGTVLGEVLKNWRIKALANLRVLENAERPTAQDFKIAVSEMMDNLVASYATLEDYRRFKNGNLILDKFEKLAQRVMETLKGCTNYGLMYPGGPSFRV